MRWLRHRSSASSPVGPIGLDRRPGFLIHLNAPIQAACRLAPGPVSHAFGRTSPSYGRYLDVDDWRPIATAPFDRDLALSVIEASEVHALVFPCRRAATGWINASTKSSVVVDPTHWRPWTAAAGAGGSAAPLPARSIGGD
jgi:hypothetical protein